MTAHGYGFGEPEFMPRALAAIEAYATGDHVLLHELLDTGGPDATDVAVALARVAYACMRTVAGMSCIPVRQVIANTRRQALHLLAEDA